MRYVIDRIEEMIAVCETENREMIEIPLHALPFAAKEGTAFEKTGDCYILIDNSSKHKKIRNLMDELWN